MSRLYLQPSKCCSSSSFAFRRPLQYPLQYPLSRNPFPLAPPPCHPLPPHRWNRSFHGGSHRLIAEARCSSSWVDFFAPDSRAGSVSAASRRPVGPVVRCFGASDGWPRSETNPNLPVVVVLKREYTKVPNLSWWFPIPEKKNNKQLGSPIAGDPPFKSNTQPSTSDAPFTIVACSVCVLCAVRCVTIKLLVGGCWMPDRWSMYDHSGSKNPRPKPPPLWEATRWREPRRLWLHPRELLGAKEVLGVRGGRPSERVREKEVPNLR